MPPPQHAHTHSLTHTHSVHKENISINLCTNQLWKKEKFVGFWVEAWRWGYNREENGGGEKWNIKPAILF